MPLCPLSFGAACLPLNKTKTGGDSQVEQAQPRTEPVYVNVWVSSRSSQVGSHWQSHLAQSVGTKHGKPFEMRLGKGQIFVNRGQCACLASTLQTTHSPFLKVQKLYVLTLSLIIMFCSGCYLLFLKQSSVCKETGIIPFLK